MNVQFADGARKASDFPAAWGEPPGDPYSEERHRWILERIATAPVRSSGSRSAHVALAKAKALAGERDYRRSAHLALWRVESLARSSMYAWHRAQHEALRVRP